jgi:hypothetical protein
LEQTLIAIFSSTPDSEIFIAVVIAFENCCRINRIVNQKFRAIFDLKFWIHRNIPIKICVNNGFGWYLDTRGNSSGHSSVERQMHDDLRREFFPVRPPKQAFISLFTNIGPSGKRSAIQKVLWGVLFRVHFIPNSANPDKN